MRFVLLQRRAMTPIVGSWGREQDREARGRTSKFYRLRNDQLLTRDMGLHSVSFTEPYSLSILDVFRWLLISPTI